MKKTFLIVLTILALHLNASSQETMTNTSVIEYTELGFGIDVIISKINSSNVDFDVSMNALKELKSNGVSTEVLAVMIDKSKSSTKSDSGIYYKQQDDLIKIEPTVFAGSKSSALGSMLSYGIASAKVKSYAPGIQSRNIIDNGNAEFIFRFEDYQDDKLGDNWWFKAATSPNEFVLTKLKVKKNKNQRELVTAKVNAFTASSQTGIDSENTIPFTFENIGGKIYKVVITETLEPGEYCFFYQGNIPQGGNYQNQSIFDFSVQ